MPQPLPDRHQADGPIAKQPLSMRVPFGLRIDSRLTSGRFYSKAALTSAT
jgi:hypothetical protein